MNILKPLAVAAMSVAMLVSEGTAASALKMPPELVDRSFRDGVVEVDGVSYEDSYCTAINISKTFDRRVGVSVYTISFNCRDESDSGNPDSKNVLRMYVSKGTLFVCDAERHCSKSRDRIAR
jgi:hypothetical protein